MDHHSYNINRIFVFHDRVLNVIDGILFRNNISTRFVKRDFNDIN